MNHTQDYISAQQAGTLDGLLLERVRRSGDRLAYRWYDGDRQRWCDLTWNQVAHEVARWRSALAREALASGDRVAVMLRNSPEWVMFDQAALSLGLVNVPLYTNDRPDNIADILADSGAKLLLLQDVKHWNQLAPALADQRQLQRVLIQRCPGDGLPDDPLLRCLDQWLPPSGEPLPQRQGDPHALASIVYTSGTTGKSKGVMLSHHNMLAVADGGLAYVTCYSEDLFLSFLPLSHTLERTAGYYLPMMSGSAVAYSRSIHQLAQDFIELRPSVIMAVPRIFERIHGKMHHQLATGPAISRFLFHQAVRLGWHSFEVKQGRAAPSLALLLQPLLDRLVGAKVRQRMGGRLRAAVTGGAPLSNEIARTFIGLGVPLLQGYGLTETAPVISVNPPEDNEPASVGLPLRDIQVRIGAQDELLVKSPGVMLGYWNNPEATQAIIDADGWLHTGDQARMERGHIFITGRIKDILVLSNGEKVPPADLEMAIALNPLVDQAMVIGEGQAYLTALLVLNQEHWPAFARQHGVDPNTPNALHQAAIIAALTRLVRESLSHFPGYAKIRRITPTLEPWTQENGLITPTMKVKRSKVLEEYRQPIARMYATGPSAE